MCLDFGMIFYKYDSKCIPRWMSLIPQSVPSFFLRQVTHPQNLVNVWDQASWTRMENLLCGEETWELRGTFCRDGPQSEKGRYWTAWLKKKKIRRCPQRASEQWTSLDNVFKDFRVVFQDFLVDKNPTLLVIQCA